MSALLCEQRLDFLRGIDRTHQASQNRDTCGTRRKTGAHTAAGDAPKGVDGEGRRFAQTGEGAEANSAAVPARGIEHRRIDDAADPGCLGPARCFR